MSQIEYPAEQWITEIIGSDIGRTVHDVFSHPDEAITFEELSLIRPSTDEDTLQNQIEELIELGVLEYVGDEPFIGLTENGKQFIVDSRMYRGSPIMKNLYQRTQMTDEVREKFELERPEEYLKRIVHPEFEEREWVRNSDEFKQGFDNISVTARLRLEELEDFSGFSVVFERNPSPDVEDEWEIVKEVEYKYTQDEIEALGEDRDRYTKTSENKEYLSHQGTEQDYEIEIDVYGLDNTLSPTISARVVNKNTSLSPTVSVFIEPNL